jgi:alpha-beta hydrolase superfamily lysophospholipase
MAGSYGRRRRATTACVLFAHQLSSTRAEYVPVIARLRGRLICYAIDLRGHGAAAGPTAR